MSAACCSRAERQNEKRQSRIRRRLLLFLQLATLARSHALRPFSSLSHQSSRRHFSLALGTNKESALVLTGTCKSARGSHAGSARSCQARTGPASPRRRTRPRLPSKYLQCVRRSPWLLKLFGKREEECASERKAACVNAAKGGGEEKKREELRWSCVQSTALQSFFFSFFFSIFLLSFFSLFLLPSKYTNWVPLFRLVSLSLSRSLSPSLPPSLSSQSPHQGEESESRETKRPLSTRCPPPRPSPAPACASSHLLQLLLLPPQSLPAVAPPGPLVPLRRSCPSAVAGTLKPPP
jgi:hypothetical protein